MLGLLSRDKVSPPTQGNLSCRASRARDTVQQMAVLRVLALYGMVPIQEVADALDVENQNAKKTLKILRERGDVAWCRWHDIKNDKSTRGPAKTIHIHSLTEKGRNRLLRTDNFPPEQATALRSWKGEPKNLPRMDHNRGVIRILIAFEKALKECSALSCSDFLVETLRQKRDKKSVSITSDTMSNGKTVISDAIMLMQSRGTGNRFTVFVEYENVHTIGEMAKKLRTKLINYKLLFLTENRRFNAGQPLLFYVVSSKTRVSEIFKAEDVSPLLGVLRVGFIDDVEADPLGKSWTRGAMVEGRFKLVKWSPIHG